MDAVRAGMKVRIAGRDETFVVLRIDRERHLADLLQQGSLHKIEADIPVVSLRPVEEADEVKPPA